jgi:hypothetical protein
VAHRTGRLLAGLALLLIASGEGRAAAPPKPRLALRAAPSTGTPSTLFVFQAVLTGGEDGEGLYCLTTEWLWEEQADSSINESECPPYKAGETPIQRSFSEEQSFRSPGPHFVKVVLRKGDREIASAGITVTVRPER